METMVVVLGCLLTICLGIIIYLLIKHRGTTVSTNSERDRVLTLINNLTSAIISTDSEGLVTMYNAFSLDLIDTNKDIEGKFIGDLFKISTSDDEPVDLFAELKKATHLKQTSDWQITLGEDDFISLETIIAPIRSGGESALNDSPDGYILILRDITKQKSIEEEKNEFISVVSHELRTPVTIAEGALSNILLLMEKPETGRDKLIEGTRTAYDQIIYLSTMVNDLSMLSRAERGLPEEPEEIDIEELAYSLYEDYSAKAKAKDLQLNLDLKPNLGVITTSRLYLREILQNLIVNAIKYTQHGSVTLRVERSTNNVKISIIDTGIGISRSDQNRIFKRFYRAEDYRTRETSGTGLGLYVANKLAKKMGCRIELESRLNHGSTFSLILEV